MGKGYLGVGWGGGEGRGRGVRARGRVAGAGGGQCRLVSGAALVTWKILDTSSEFRCCATSHSLAVISIRRQMSMSTFMAFSWIFVSRSVMGCREDSRGLRELGGGPQARGRWEAPPGSGWMEGWGDPPGAGQEVSAV